MRAAEGKRSPPAPPPAGRTARGSSLALIDAGRERKFAKASAEELSPRRVNLIRAPVAERNKNETYIYTHTPTTLAMVRVESFYAKSQARIYTYIDAVEPL